MNGLKILRFGNWQMKCARQQTVNLEPDNLSSYYYRRYASEEKFRSDKLVLHVNPKEI